jgi:hypothetical protein
LGIEQQTKSQQLSYREYMAVAESDSQVQTDAIVERGGLHKMWAGAERKGKRWRGAVDEPWSDPRLRRAIKVAVDQEGRRLGEAVRMEASSRGEMVL